MLVAAYVLAAYLLAYAPKYLVTLALIREKNYDNQNPREQQAKLEGWKKRGVAAHQNGFESFAGFAAACILATIAHVDPFWINTLCLVHLGARSIYPIVYIAGLGWTRSAVWTVGLVCTIALFVFAFMQK